MATSVSVSTSVPAGAPCGHCPIRARAEKHPQHFLSRLWRRRWHNKLCPGWRISRRAPGKVG